VLLAIPFLFDGRAMNEIFAIAQQAQKGGGIFLVFNLRRTKRRRMLNAQVGVVIHRKNASEARSHSFR
jgi:hypothetical protein